MAFRKTLGAVGTTAILSLAAIGAVSPAANAEDVSQGATHATIEAHRPGNGELVNANSQQKTSPSTSSNAVAATTSHTKPNAPQSVSCWNGSTSGRNFYETCNGSNYRPYVDCSNGYRYVFGVFNGEWNLTLTCPAGSNAVWGGAIG